MIQHCLNKISKLKIKHLKDPGNQKAFKGVPKKPKIILKGLAKRNKSTEEGYKIYKALSEKLKKKSKKSYFLNLTDKYKNYIKKTQDVMKEIIGKLTLKIKKLPHRIVIDEKEKDFPKVLGTVNYKILIRKLKKIWNKTSIYRLG